MKYRIKYLLLIIIVLFSVACGRRPARHSNRGRSRGNPRREVVGSDKNNYGSESVAPVITTKSINRTKPDVRQMQKDLIGHSLSEGVNNGYYNSTWRWAVCEDEISNFSIERIIKESSTEYEVVARMRLTSRAGKAFDAGVKLCYLFSESQGWYLQLVQSLGMQIVKTGRYSDCVKVEQEGWWYYINNYCEVALEVGGRELNCGRWKKYSHVVEPHGGYCMYNPEEIIIDYVERP